MAFVWNKVASAAGGKFEAFVRYNDQNLIIDRGRVVNNTTLPGKVTVVMDPPIGGFSTVEVLGPANAPNTEVNFPNSLVKYVRDLEDNSLSLPGINIGVQYPSA